jgi:hypothetical protein
MRTQALAPDFLRDGFTSVVVFVGSLYQGVDHRLTGFAAAK